MVSSCARSAVEVSVPAEASSSVEADETVSTISPTATFEIVGELDHVGLALLGGDLVLLDLGFGLVAGLLLGLDFEGLDRLRHVADFVLAVEPGKHHAEIAAGEFLHAGGEAGQRADNAASDQERDQQTKQ